MTHSTFTLIQHQFSQPCRGFHLGQEGASDLFTNSLNDQRKVEMTVLGWAPWNQALRWRLGAGYWGVALGPPPVGTQGAGWAEVVCNAVAARIRLIPGGALELRCPLEVSCTETGGACHCTLAFVGYE